MVKVGAKRRNFVLLAFGSQDGLQWTGKDRSNYARTGGLFTDLFFVCSWISSMFFWPVGGRGRFWPKYLPLPVIKAIECIRKGIWETQQGSFWRFDNTAKPLIPWHNFAQNNYISVNDRKRIPRLVSLRCVLSTQGRCFDKWFGSLGCFSKWRRP